MVIKRRRLIRPDLALGKAIKGKGNYTFTVEGGR